ncbi:Asp-tRNA(Asn)/Glu-tRNA(Gln) amidotransferase subunit GatA [Spirochaetia bacterium 38H-sp]|uniref:Glutamyl-tRNA(Gln) amidotransferase subunit A n=1 Tax=Rarispira pelagica TaxID=3141764 RepID=A0ABU9U908_9SPIR
MDYKPIKEADISTYEDKLLQRDKEIGSFLSVDIKKGYDLAEKRGELVGLLCGVKDNIAVEGFPLTCGSKMLENLSSPYSATAIKKLIEQGAVVAGKTNLDEFGMGSSCDNSALKITNNPWDTSRVAGGSSGGSAAAVAAGIVPCALGTDTGGSIRQPAAFCGVYGLKPTYGTVSRYGLVAYASSLEVIGPLARDINIVEKVYDIIKGEDDRDQSSVEIEEVSPDVKRIAVLRGDLGLDDAVAKVYTKTEEGFKSLGYEIVDVELPVLDYVVPAYYTIATAEASANLARYTGIRYGHRTVWAENPQELVEKSRSEGFGPEVKLRILLGTFVLRSGFQDKYYHKAQKIRTAIRMALDEIFKKSDVLLMPVFPTQAFLHGEAGLSSFQQKMADKFTTTANMAGVPALAFPAGQENNLPVGMQLVGPAFAEKRLFDTARAFREVFTIEYPEKYLPLWS